MKRFLAAILGLALIPALAFAGSVTLTTTDKGQFNSIRVIEFAVDCDDLDGDHYDTVYYNSTDATSVNNPIMLDQPYRIIGVDWLPATTAVPSGTGLGSTQVPDDDADLEIRSTITGVDILDGAGDDVPASSSDSSELFQVPVDTESGGYVVTRVNEGLYLYGSNLNVTNSNAKGSYFLYLQQL